jgi:hypothetical protein
MKALAEKGVYEGLDKVKARLQADFGRLVFGGGYLPDGREIFADFITSATPIRRSRWRFAAAIRGERRPPHEP